MENNVYRLIRIFVSSTFRDMDFERDYLKNVLIPKLNKEMSKYDILIELCDLRTGLAKIFTSEQEQEEYILQSCFSAIKNTYPYFIAMVGDRYGWTPPEESINNLNQVFQEFCVESSAVTGKSVTELEIILGCLNEEKRNRGIVCFRSEKSYENMPEDIRKEYVEDSEESRSHLTRLKETIRSKFNEWNKNDSIIDYQLGWHDNKFIHLEKWGDKVYETIKRQILLDISPKDDGRSRIHHIMDNFVTSNLYRAFDNNTGLSEVATNGIIRDYNKLIFSGHEGSGKSTFLSQYYYRVVNDTTNIMPVFYSLDASGADCSFDAMIEFLTQQTNKYILQLYDNHPVYNPDNPLESLRESINWMADNEYNMLFIIDSYNKIQRHSNPYHHSLRWVPDNAAVIISVDSDWIAEFSEKVLVFPQMPIPNKEMARTYIKTLGYKDLTDDIINMILKPIFKEEEEIDAYYRTPLWIRMVVDLLVDLNHNDYNIIRSGEKDYSTALKEYREKIIPTQAISSEQLFLKIVQKNSSVIGDEGFTLMLLLALSKYGLREETLRAYMEMDEVKFTRILSVTFNKFSKYINFSPETGRWYFKYEICKRGMIIGGAELQNFHNTYKKLLQVMLLELKEHNLAHDDLFYYMLCSNNTAEAETLLNEWNAKVIEHGAREIAEEILNKNNTKACLDWCMNLLSQGERVTETKIAFITKVFEKIYKATRLKPSIEEIKSITKVILQEFIPDDYIGTYTVVDFFNLMTDIFIYEDEHLLASLTNKLAIGYVSTMEEEEEIPGFDKLKQTALKQQRALIQKDAGYIINTENKEGEQEVKIDETIEQMKEDLAIKQQRLAQEPTNKNKLNLIGAHTKLAVNLYETDFPEAFGHHEEALLLISEVLEGTFDTNYRRSCSSYLFQWAETCLKNDNTKMAAAIFDLVLELDGQLITEHETKENLVNVITVLNKLTRCCAPEDVENIKKYSRKALYFISKLKIDDFNLCCSFWLKHAQVCLDKQAYYEAFCIYDTMGDALIEKNDPAYLFMLIEVQIKIAEIAFIDGGRDAGLYRINYPLSQIEEVRDLPMSKENTEQLNLLWKKCQDIIKKYS